MKKAVMQIAVGVLALTAAVGVPLSVRYADAAPPPGGSGVSDCGKVVLVNSTVLGAGPCKAWKANSGWTYRFNGVDAYNVGDEIHVTGTLCTYCIGTCQAAVLLNAQVSACGR